MHINNLKMITTEATVLSHPEFLFSNNSSSLLHVRAGCEVSDIKMATSLGVPYKNVSGANKSLPAAV